MERRIILYRKWFDFGLSFGDIDIRPIAFLSFAIFLVLLPGFVKSSDGIQFISIAAYFGYFGTNTGDGRSCTVSTGIHHVYLGCFPSA